MGRPILARSVRKVGFHGDNSRGILSLVVSSREAHLPALMKAPVVALITLMPFLSFSLVP